VEWIGQLIGIDSKLGVGVGRQRVMLGELDRDETGGLGLQALVGVERRKLIQFLLRIVGQFAPLRYELGSLTVALTTDGDVLAEAHRDGTRDEARQSCGEYWSTIRGGTGNTDDQACRRYDPVVGAEHTGTKPIQTGSHGGLMRLTRMGY
jgi:hypothetical protein